MLRDLRPLLQTEQRSDNVDLTYRSSPDHRFGLTGESTTQFHDAQWSCDIRFDKPTVSVRTGHDCSPMGYVNHDSSSAAATITASEREEGRKVVVGVGGCLAAVLG